MHSEGGPSQGRLVKPGVSQGLYRAILVKIITCRQGRVPLGCRVIENANIWATTIVAALFIDEVVDVTFWLWGGGSTSPGVRGLLRRGGGCSGAGSGVVVAGGWGGREGGEGNF